MAIKNQDHPFFRPLWRRGAIVIVTALWCLVEAYHGQTTWVYLTGAVCAYAIWTFFITYPGTYYGFGERAPSAPSRPEEDGK